MIVDYVSGLEEKVKELENDVNFKNDEIKNYNSTLNNTENMINNVLWHIEWNSDVTKTAEMLKEVTVSMKEISMYIKKIKENNLWE